MQEAVYTNGMSKRYEGRAVVDDVGLRIGTGAVFGFLGPNGAGKTTTIRMLLGLARPDAGRIHVLGREMPRDRAAILREVGAVIETPTHYDHLTGAENLEVTTRLLGLARGEIDRVLGIVALSDAACIRVGAYSLGMRQRLGIARALLGKPRLLVLDEPTNGLDPDGMRDMRALIRALPDREGCTVLLCSHLLSEVEQVATEIGLMWRGRLIAQGTLQSVLQGDAGPIELVTDRPDDAARLLGAHGYLADTLAGSRLAVRGRADAAHVNSLLNKAGLSVSHLSRRERSLEDVYADLTRAPRLLETCA